MFSLLGILWYSTFIYFPNYILFLMKKSEKKDLIEKIRFIQNKSWFFPTLQDRAWSLLWDIYLVSYSEPYWSQLVRLANATGSRLLYDLNLQMRDGSQWSPLNTMELLQFAVYEGLAGLVDFELGNGKRFILVSC